MYKYLNSIKKSSDLKKIKQKNLKQLCKEIRTFLISNLSKTGGHLSSNLGAVELTTALNYVYNPEKDVIVYDVGHQTYVHKLLTGRIDKFKNLRKENGLSGFPDPSEHVSDRFKTGHVGTAIGMAAGYLYNNEDNKNIISVIGDGSLTNGEIFESLNFIANTTKKMIIIYNDNGMSISKTNSAISKFFSKFTAELGIRSKLKKLYLKKLLPKKIYTFFYRIFSSMKSIFLTEAMLEDYGLQYVGPIDGHDLNEIIKYLRFAKNYNRTILLHLQTTKGKGYSFSEEDPEKFHSAKPFDIETGRFVVSHKETYTHVMGNFVEKLGSKDDEIRCLSAAMKLGCGLSNFDKKHPSKFIDVGIAEEFQVSLTASLSKAGLKPYCFFYSTFTQRSLDQIYHDVVLNDANSVFCIDRHGFVGGDGPTHHGTFSQNFITALPNVKIYNPSFKEEFLFICNQVNNFEDVNFIQYPKSEIYTWSDLKYKYPFISNNEIDSIEKEINNKYFIDTKKYSILNGYYLKKSENKNILFVVTGNILFRILDIAKYFLENNINIDILVNPNLKFDISKDIYENLNNYKQIYTFEESYEPSFLYYKYLKKYKNIKGFYIKEKIIPHASRERQLDIAGFDREIIINTVKEGIVNVSS